MQGILQRVLQLIAEGRLTELTLEVLPEEILGLYEDMLNFELGHACEGMASALKTSMDDNIARLDSNIASAKAIVARSRIVVAQCRRQREGEIA